MTTITNIATELLQENGFIQDSTSITVTAAMLKAENGYLETTTNVTVTAALVLAENNYVVGDCTAVNTEYLIDNAINYINMQANTTIPALSGAAGSKTGSADRNEATIIKSLSALMIKAYKDRGPNVSIGAITAATVLNDPQYALHADIIKAGISRLQTLSARNLEYVIDNAIGYVNGQTGLQMSLMSGGVGDKTASLTGSQASVVKLIAGILLKVALSRGGDVTLQTVTKDPQYSFYGEMIKNAVDGLQTLKADYVEYLTDNAIRYVSSEANTSIAALSGAGGAKSLTGTDAQIAAVKALASNMLREATGQKPSPTLMMMVDKTIEKIRIEETNDITTG